MSITITPFNYLQEVRLKNIVLLIDMSQSTMQLDHQGAFIKVEHAVSDLLEVQLQFRTLKPDTILLYTETVSDTDQDTGYIQVSCLI